MSLLNQRAAVRKLGFDVDPHFAEITNDTLARMEARLSRLRASHADMLEQAAPIYQVLADAL